MQEPKLTTLFGIGLIGLSTLILELVLTRIFSVSMYHHFAFLAISVSLLGLGASGVFLSIFPDRFPETDLMRQLGWVTLLAALSASFGFLIQNQVPFIPSFDFKGLFTLGIKYSLMTVPFFFNGLALALLFRHFPEYAGKIYFADLTGAGLGCLATIPILSILGGSSSVFFVSILGCLAALLFFHQAEGKRKNSPSIALVVLVALLLINIKSDIFQIKSASKIDKTKTVYQAWNSYSRITVYDLKSKEGLLSTTSRRYRGELPDWRFIEIDATAGTHLLHYSSLEQLQYLKYDLTYVPFYLGPKGKVLIIGAGGGRDVLAALVFGQKEITGVEVNPLIVDIVKNNFGEFSNHLYNNPKVKIVVDEARSYLSRSDEKFDYIQAPLACTWASSAAGSFVLTENSLYTQEAFSIYLNRLKEHGLLSMTMWFRGTPGELLRLVSLGISGLKEIGIDNPEKHIIVLTKANGFMDQTRLVPKGYGTFILKKSPFTRNEIARIFTISQDLGFNIRCAPGFSEDPAFNNLLQAADSQSPVGFLDISPPVDDKPFFFYLLRFGDFWKVITRQSSFIRAFKGDELHLYIVFILVGLLVVTLVFSFLFVVIPLYVFKTGSLKGNLRSIMYFACLGMGFMLIEIPLIQRFILFLGKPIYSLSVILFSLLIFSGIGSYLTEFIKYEQCRKKIIIILALLIALLTFYIYVLPDLLDLFIMWTASGRIMISVLLLAPLGLLMGMPFPLGIKLHKTRTREIIPWACGINGVASVLATVLSIIIALNFGYKNTLLVGLLMYLFALLTMFTIKTSG